MKFYIDNRSAPELYYDGESMGFGQLCIPCSECTAPMTVETFEIIKRHKKLSNEHKSSYGAFLNLENLALIKSLDFASISCEQCSKEHVFYVKADEVQSGRYQSSLLAVIVQ